jgi:hypothetical protein
MPKKYRKKYVISEANPKKNRAEYSTEFEISVGLQKFLVKRLSEWRPEQVEFHVGLDKGEVAGLWLTFKKDKVIEKIPRKCGLCGNGQSGYDTKVTKDAEYNFFCIKRDEFDELIAFLLEARKRNWREKFPGRYKKSKPIPDLSFVQEEEARL